MKKIINFLKSIGFVFLYFILSISLYNLLKKYVYSNDVLLSGYSILFCDLVVLLVFIIIFRKKIIPDYYSFKTEYLSESFIYYFIGLIIMFLSSTIISLFINIEATNQLINESLIFTCPLPNIISAIIVAPMLEELVFRCNIKQAIKNKYIFIILSGLIFGGIHLLSASSINELWYIIPYASMGCTFAYIYYKTDNIWTTISFHAFHNTLAVLSIFVGGLL